MTQGRKRMVILFVILAAVLMAIWGYLALTGRQSENPGYLVRENGYGIEKAAEYGPEYQTGPGMRTEKKHGTEPGFHEVHEAEILEVKYVEEGKCCHG